MITTLTKKSHLVSFKSFWLTKTCAKLLGGFVAPHRFLMLVALPTVCFAAATAQAQDTLNNSASASTAITSGWWSPERASLAATPHLLNKADLLPFAASESLEASTVRSSTQPATESTASIVSRGVFGLTPDTREAGFSAAMQGLSLPPEPSFSFLRTKYLLWESSLADTRTLTNVNGVSVYPLGQIDYADWHLPVSLYIAPLRGSDAR